MLARSTGEPNLPITRWSLRTGCQLKCHEQCETDKAIGRELSRLLGDEMSENLKLKAPFQYFGGKRKVAEYVNARLGESKQYIEPFCGSAAVLLNRKPSSLEVIGDLDLNVANFWRALKHQPEEVARWCDNPVVHIELHARHAWLTEPARVVELRENLSDPEWSGDAKHAGWWCWGNACWIGSGWCDSPKKIAHASDAGRGVTKKIAHASNAGRGVTKKIAHAGNAGMGVSSQAGSEAIQQWLANLSDRLRHVRVQNSSWDRLLNMHYGKSSGGIVAVFMDPPYLKYEKLYSESSSCAIDAMNWAKENACGNVRVAICGNAGDYDLPGWDVYEWSRAGTTYGSSKTKDAECIWFSPNCLAAP